MNDIEKQVLRYIGDDPDSPDVFTDSNIGLIRNSICDAIEEIAALTGGYTRRYYLPLKTGKHFYRVDSKIDNFGWIRAVWLSDNKSRLIQTDLFKISKQNPNWLDVSATPTNYLQIGFDIIGVYPSPASDADYLDIDMVMIPGRYDDDLQKIRLRDEHQQAVIHYAVGEFWASRGDANTAIQQHNMYLKKLGLNVKYPFYSERNYSYKTANGTSVQVAA